MSVRSLLGFWLVKGANDRLPLGVDDRSNIGLALDSILDDGIELCAEIGEATGMSVGLLLGFRLVDGDGAAEELPVGLYELPVGLDEGANIGLSIGLALIDGVELGTELGETTGIAVGSLLGFGLVDGANDGLPLGRIGDSVGVIVWVLAGSDVGPTEGDDVWVNAGPMVRCSVGHGVGPLLVGVSVGEAAGTSVGAAMKPSDGEKVRNGAGEEAGLPVRGSVSVAVGPLLGIGEGSKIELSLGSMLNDGIELGKELCETTGISVGTLLGDWLVDVGGADVGVLGEELAEPIGMSIGPLLGDWLVGGEGAVDGVLLGLDEEPEIRLLLGSRLTDEGNELGTKLVRTSVDPLLVDLDGNEDGLPLGVDVISVIEPSLGSALNDDGNELGTELGETNGVYVGPLLGAGLVEGDGEDDGLALGPDTASEIGDLLGSTLKVDGNELGGALSETSRISVGPLLGDWLVDSDGDGAWLVDIDGVADGCPMGRGDWSFTGLSLGSLVNDDGPELGNELGETVGIFTGPLLGAWLFEAKGANDGLPLAIDAGSKTGPSLGSRLIDGTELSVELGETTRILIGLLLGAILVDTDVAGVAMPFGVNEGSKIGLLLGSRLTDGPDLGTELGETTRVCVGPPLCAWLVEAEGVKDGPELGSLLGSLLVDVDGVEEGCLRGLDDGSIRGLWLGSMFNDELGAELGETSGMSVGPVLGSRLFDCDISDDGDRVGLIDGPETGFVLGLTLKNEDTEVGCELGEATRISVGPLLGTLNDDCDGTDDGLVDGSETELSLGLELSEGTKLVVELGETAGMSVGPLLGSLLFDGDGANDEVPVWLDDGFGVGHWNGSVLSEEGDADVGGCDLGKTTGISVEPLLVGWLVDIDGDDDDDDGPQLGLVFDETDGPWLGALDVDGGVTDDELPLGLDDGYETGLSLGSRLTDGTIWGVVLGEDSGISVLPMLGRLLDNGDGDGVDAGLPSGCNVDGLPLEFDDGPEMGRELGETDGIFVGPPLGALLIDIDGVEDSFPLGLVDGAFSGLSLGSLLDDDESELGSELGEATGISLGPWVGTWLVAAEGASDELGLKLGEASGISVRKVLGTLLAVGDGEADGLLLGPKDTSFAGVSLGLRLTGTELGAVLDETTGMSVGPLLGRMLDDGKDANDGLSLGPEERSKIGLMLGSGLVNSTELGVELGEATGMSVGPLLGT
jgi:hypothetical protein